MAIGGALVGIALLFGIYEYFKNKGSTGQIPDIIPPTGTITQPAAGNTTIQPVSFPYSLTVKGTAADNVSLASVQVAILPFGFAGLPTWVLATGTADWQKTFSISQSGSYVVKVRITDGNRNTTDFDLPIIINEVIIPPPLTHIDTPAAVAFIKRQYNSSAKLVRGSPDNNPDLNKYWLWTDNALVYYVLMASGFASNDPVTGQTIKTQVLSYNYPFRHPIGSMLGLPASYLGSNEVNITNTPVPVWVSDYNGTANLLNGNFADIHFYRAMDLYREGDMANAKLSYDKGIATFDQVGMKDSSTLTLYATYKSLLWMIAHNATGFSPAPPQSLVDQMIKQQVPATGSPAIDIGGFTTEYDSSGTPKGGHNVETTALAIIAFNPSAFPLPPPQGPGDTIPPNTSITSFTDGTGTLITNGGSTESTTVRITFSGTDNVSVSRFEGKLDSQSWITQTSPATKSSLSIGPHTYSVRAIDAAGNIDPTPASVSWTVNTLPPPPGGGSFDQIVIVLMENHGLSSVYPTGAPYLTQLANQYGISTNWNFINHPSYPNYLALIAGSTEGITSDGVTTNFDKQTIVDIMENTGKTWAAYMEGANGTGSALLTQQRKRDHFPFLSFTTIMSVPARAARLIGGGTSAVINAFNAGVNFIWFTPTDSHNMHNNTVASGDTWLKSWVPNLLAAMQGKKALLFIVFDEDSGPVYAGFSGPAAKLAHKSAVHYNHYSFLKLIESTWGGGSLGQGDVNASNPSEFIA